VRVLCIPGDIGASGVVRSWSCVIGWLVRECEAVCVVACRGCVMKYRCYRLESMMPRLTRQLILHSLGCLTNCAVPVGRLFHACCVNAADDLAVGGVCVSAVVSVSTPTDVVRGPPPQQCSRSGRLLGAVGVAPCRHVTPRSDDELLVCPCF
jgi:hypothetical protein